MLRPTPQQDLPAFRDVIDATGDFPGAMLDDMMTSDLRAAVTDRQALSVIAQALGRGECCLSGLSAFSRKRRCDCIEQRHRRFGDAIAEIRSSCGVELPSQRNGRRIKLRSARDYEFGPGIESAFDDSDLSRPIDDRVQIAGGAVQVRLQCYADILQALAESTVHAEHVVGAIGPLGADDHLGARRGDGRRDAERVLEAKIVIDKQSDVRQIERDPWSDTPHAEAAYKAARPSSPATWSPR